METPEVVVLTAEGWWVKSFKDDGGWWWRRIDVEMQMLARYSRLPEIVETYQPSSVIHELARTAE